MEQQTLRMRVLSEVAGDETTPTSWFAKDFWKTAAAGLSNLVTIAVLIGWVKSTSSEELTGAIVALVGAAEVIFVNSALIWRHLTAAKEVEVEAMKMRMMLLQSMPDAPIGQMCQPRNPNYDPGSPSRPRR